MPRTKKAPQELVSAPEKRPAIYLRVSTQEQADSGLGLAAQEARCKALCAVKGWPDAVIYADEGISGTLGPDKRPQLGLLLAAIDAGQISAVIVLDLSRLGRTVKIITSLVETFEAAGVAFVSVKESFDTSTAMGRAMLNIVAVFGQLERDLTAERTRAALSERGKQDGEMGGRLPYGYIRGESGLAIEPRAAALVRTIFALRASGETLQAIADTVQPLASGPRGGLWYPSTIREVLQNESAYRGNTRGASSIRWPAIL